MRILAIILTHLCTSRKSYERIRSQHTWWQQNKKHPMHTICFETHTYLCMYVHMFLKSTLRFTTIIHIPSFLPSFIFSPHLFTGTYCVGVAKYVIYWFSSSCRLDRALGKCDHKVWNILDNRICHTELLALFPYTLVFFFSCLSHYNYIKTSEEYIKLRWKNIKYLLIVGRFANGTGLFCSLFWKFI